MRRRSFLFAGGAGLIMSGLRAADSKRAIIELRDFQLRNTTDNMPGRTGDFLSKGLLPALERAGVKGPGFFSNLVGQGGPRVLMVTSYPSLAIWESVREKIWSDTEFSKLRAAYAAGPLGYVRMETTLLRAFETMPSIELPPASESKSRIFELRTYASNNLTTLARKIRMFDEGEIALFRKLNMRPVFFGETIAGRDMPNLTYMLAYEDWAAREKAWSTFVSHPEWTKMKNQPGVSDGEIVSNISNSLLRAMPFSAIR